MSPWKNLQAARDIWWFLLFLLLATTALSGWNILRSARNEWQVARTLRTMRALDRYRTAIVDAETGARGFVIVGDRAYLEPFHAALTIEPDLVSELSELLADNPDQTARLQTLIPLCEQRIELLRKLIAVRDSRVRNPPREVEFVAEGKRRMDDIRSRLDQLLAVERERLDHRGESAEATLTTAIVSLAIGAAITIAILALARSLIRREAETRQRAQAELERQVQERTSQLQGAVADLNAEAAERERTTEELFKTAEELSRSNRELEQFAYIASHDLQEPLRKIQTFGDRLKSLAGDRIDEQTRDYISRMQASASRMRRLIDDLLAFSRVTTRPQAFATVDLNVSVREALTDLEDAVVRLNGRVDVGPLPKLRADPVQIQHLLQNLLSNALKFHKPGEPPVVTVRAETLPRMPDDPTEKPDRPAVRLEVSDSGIGFDEAYRDRIFQVFQRLHGRNEYEGTGIGLAVVRRIAERHGGTVTATSAPGQGATFVVTLPSGAEHAATNGVAPDNSGDRE